MPAPVITMTFLDDAKILAMFCNWRLSSFLTWAIDMTGKDDEDDQ